MSDVDKLREDLHRRERELELLHEFNLRLAGVDDVEGVVKVLSSLGRELVECDSFVIMLAEHGELRPNFADSPHASNLTNAALLGLEEPIIEESWSRRKALQLTTSAQQKTIFDDETSSATFLIGDKGLLYLGKRASGGFPAATTRLLTTLTRQAGLSLQSVERLAQTGKALASQKSALASLEAWTQGLEHVSDGTRELQETLDTEGVLERFGALVSKLLPQTTQSLTFKGDQLMGPAVPTELTEHVHGLQRPLSLGEISQTRLPPLAEGQESLLIVPLLEPDGAVGGLFLGAQEKNAFSGLQARLASLLALQFQSSWSGAQMHGKVVEAYQKLEESEASLVQASKLAAVGQLAAGVAHELNTPLATILLEVEFLEMELDPDEETSASFNKMTHELLRAQDIVAKLLYYSRDAAKGDKTVELNEVVRDSLGLVDSQLGLAGIDIQVKLSEERLPLTGNANEIQQILLNLLINTRDALEGCADARVIVATQLQGPDVVMTVSDNGPGINAEIARQIFDPFFTTKPVGKGTGLGLSISRRLAERHGGTLELLAQERGASFCLKIPKKELAL